MSSYFREPKTFQERKQSLDSLVKVRSKRNAKNLPTTWDDIKKGRKKSFTNNQRKRSRKGFRLTIRKIINTETE